MSSIEYLYNWEINRITFDKMNKKKLRCLIQLVKGQSNEKLSAESLYFSSFIL